MTPEELQELSEKAKLWDELSPLLKTIHGSKFERPSNGTTTIENTSNASTFIDVLKEANKEINSAYIEMLQEESKEMVRIDKVRNFYHSTGIFGFFNIIKEDKICTNYGEEVGSYFSDKYLTSSLFGDYTFCIRAKYSDFETDDTNDGFFYRGEYLLNTEK